MTDSLPQSLRETLATGRVHSEQGLPGRIALKATRLTVRLSCAAGLLALAALQACSGGGGSSSNGSGIAAGTIVPNPNTGLSYIVEANQGGSGGAMRITGMFWGRLVDIYDFDVLTGAETKIFTNYVIGAGIASNGVNYRLERNPVTETESLTILHLADSAAFKSALIKAETGMQSFLDKSLDPSELPPFTAVPRNAAISVRFDDLLDDGGDFLSPNYPGSVLATNVQLRVGTPPVVPFSYRLIPDSNHGDEVNGVFHSTRVILDMTVSSLEAQISGLQVNSLGLPASQSANQASIVVRIPTIQNASAAQFDILRNLDGKGVSFSNNGSTDPASPTLDVIRAARSGGSTALTGDPNNGFLLDDIRPLVLGAQSIAMTQVSAPLGPNGDQFLIDLQFNSLTCASQPLEGDVVEVLTHVLEVTQDAGVPIGGLVTNVPVRVIFGNPATLFPVVGQFRTTWNLNASAPPECFIRFSPPALNPPNAGVPTDAGVILTFSEPMDPASITPLESFRIEYGVNPGAGNALYDTVVGAVVPAADLVSYTLEPAVPLRNQGDALNPEPYEFHLDGVTDLAGNPLLFKLPEVAFTIDPNAPHVDSLSASLNFNSTNEDNDPDGNPEIRHGQILYDLTLGEIRPRQVSRISAPVDPTQLVVNAMIPITKPIVTPLSSYGSKMMSVWRYHDMGFGLLDEQTHNLDLEALYWTPFGGGLSSDFFPSFKMSVSHSIYLPDEAVDGGLLPKYRTSGLVKKFKGNVPAEESMVVLSEKSTGYILHPLDLVEGATGTQLMPWPFNQDIPTSEYKYWTWRDTGLEIANGGPNGNGVDTARLVALAGGAIGFNQFWKKNDVPSIGLPLLMEFRTYPSSAQGLNGFQIAIAINSSAQPYFRTFSSGGEGKSGTKIVDPDQEPSGTGGVNPNNTKGTPPQDNAFYYGQADFVVRVSRTHTMWMDLFGTGTTSFAPPVLDPPQNKQPSNTSIVLAFRGASDITSTTPDAWTNARNLDPYGDTYSETQHCWLLDGTPKCDSSGSETSQGEDLVFFPTFFPDGEWHGKINEINGARFIQTRITMISNPETLLTPTLSGIGFAALQ